MFLAGGPNLNRRSRQGAPGLDWGLFGNPAITLRSAEAIIDGGLVLTGLLAAQDLRRSLRVRVQPNPIIHSVAKTLLAAQVPLRRLHGDMSQKELNLLQLTASLMAKAGASLAKVVRSERWDLTVLCFLFHDTPNYLGAESGAPNPASLVD